jgi:zinc D-Ala-D-Ala carboxypeptidase
VAQEAAAVNLSEHFTLEELSFSEIALRQGIGNQPPSEATINLTHVCEFLLEPIRKLLDVPIHVNSGYRSPAVNRLVGGAADSAHLQGRAADIVPMGFSLQDAFTLIRLSKLPYDQVIFECKAWIHVAISPEGSEPRRQALTATGSPGHWRYEVVA